MKKPQGKYFEIIATCVVLLFCAAIIFAFLWQDWMGMVFYGGSFFGSLMALSIAMRKSENGEL